MSLWAAASLTAASLACGPLSTLLPAPGPTLPAPVLWRQNVGTDTISPPALADGRLVYLESNTAVVARSAATGAEAWRHALYGPADLSRPLSVSNGVVLVEESPADSDGQRLPHVLALNLQTGQVAWQASLSAPQASANPFSQPMAAAGVVYYESELTSGERKLNAVDAATGALRWQAAMTGTSSLGDPIIDNGLLIASLRHDDASAASGFADTILAFDTATGALRWSMPLNSWVAPILAAGQGLVYAAGHDGNLWALDANTGGLVWKFHFNDIDPSPPLLAGDTVYFGDTNGQLYALDAASGALRWQAQVGSRVPSRAAVSGGRLYVGTENGLLLALDIANGSEIWRTLSPVRKSFAMEYIPPLETEPVVAAGVLYYFNGQDLIALTVP